MKKLLLTLGASFTCIILFAQNIKPEEAAKHIGENVTVCGKIYGGKFLDRSDKQITLLNMGAAYPNSLVTVRIEGDARKKFEFKPEEFYLNKEVCVTGLITDFKGKAEMQVTETTQIKVAEVKAAN